MNLVKEYWTKKDINEFRIYQKSLVDRKENADWEKRIINTKMPCLGKTTSKARIIANQIIKGNYLSFLNNVKIETLCESLVSAFLISKIDNFNVFKKYLFKFIKNVDNWASCDTLKFKNFEYDKLFQLSKTLLKSKKEFDKRIGINIFFEIYNDSKYLNDAFNVIDNLKDCDQYYVNMACSWLLSFLYIKYPTQTMKYFINHKTSKFIINKAISKCCDSYRITKQEKRKLKQFIIK